MAMFEQQLTATAEAGADAVDALDAEGRVTRDQDLPDGTGLV
jgi:hypothetical protein